MVAHWSIGWPLSTWEVAWPQGLYRGPAGGHSSVRWSSMRKRKQSAHTASFAAFTGRALTIFRAGLALNTVGSFVNGLMPARSFVAGFLITTNFAKPGNNNAPFFFNSL